MRTLLIGTVTVSKCQIFVTLTFTYTDQVDDSVLHMCFSAHLSYTDLLYFVFKISLLDATSDKHGVEEFESFIYGDRKKLFRIEKPLLR